MASRPRRPAPGLPAAEWWAPLLVDLAAVQRGSAPLGLRVRAVDLTSERAAVTIDWTDGTGTTFRPAPEADRAALLRHITGSGPAHNAPAEHDTEFWAPGGADRTPLLSHAWLLDELGRRSDAWYAYLSEPVELLHVGTDGQDTATVTVGRVSREDVVVVRIPLAGLGADGLDIGLAYTIVENAAAADRRTLPPAEPVRGWPGYVSTLRPAAPE
ncbi:hypothetical protein ABZ951_06635 [Streptomyces sp. NPDC046215]|uniref:hypothetical protein n=1 Tax=Streptomyces TaxID=1883 RepID=UPI0031E11CFA